MRKLLVAVILVITVVFGGVAVAASTPNQLEGKYSYNAGDGYRITVAYSACGHTYPWSDDEGNQYIAYDPLAKFYAKAKKGGGWTIETWAHDTTDLNGTLGIFGLSLNAEAIATLNEDAATYSCTA